MRLNVWRSCAHAFNGTHARASQRGYLYRLFLMLFSRSRLIWIREKVPLKKEKNGTASINCGMNKRCLYRVYILEANHRKLKLINRATIVNTLQDYMWKTLSSSVMVAKHKRRQLRFILRPVIIVRCIAIIWISFGRIWIVSMSTILRRLIAATKTYATKVM